MRLLALGNKWRVSRALPGIAGSIPLGPTARTKISRPPTLSAAPRAPGWGATFQRPANTRAHGQRPAILEASSRPSPGAPSVTSSRAGPGPGSRPYGNIVFSCVCGDGVTERFCRPHVPRECLSRDCDSLRARGIRAEPPGPGVAPRDGPAPARIRPPMAGPALRPACRWAPPCPGRAAPCPQARVGWDERAAACIRGKRPLLSGGEAAGGGGGGGAAGGRLGPKSRLGGLSAARPSRRRFAAARHSVAAPAGPRSGPGRRLSGRPTARDFSGVGGNRLNGCDPRRKRGHGHLQEESDNRARNDELRHERREITVEGSEIWGAHISVHVGGKNFSSLGIQDPRSRITETRKESPNFSFARSTFSEECTRCTGSSLQ